MLSNKPGTIANYVAEAAIPAHTLITFGTDEAACKLSTATTDAPLGVSTEVAAEAGERCDVILTGIANVIYGGNVARGDSLTTDDSGQAVVAVNDDVIYGMAMLDGASGDIGAINLNK